MKITQSQIMELALMLRALTDKTGVKGAEEKLCNISSVFSSP